MNRGTESLLSSAEHEQGVVGDKDIGVEGLVLAYKTWSPAHQPVASYCDKATPSGWDVWAPSLLHCQRPQLTGGGSASQFCLVGQLEGWWSAVWEKHMD